MRTTIEETAVVLPEEQPGRWVRVARWLATRSGLRDAVLFGVVYLAYSASRYAAISSKSAAISHAQSIESLEHRLHVGIEGSVQQFFDHGIIPQLFNYVYLAAQVFVIPGVLLAMFLWGPPHIYRMLRNTVLCGWLLALPVYALYPTAPPRLARLGILDTVSKDSIIPLNARLTTSFFNPYASVPSMHAGLAVAISVALVATLWHHRWLRWVGAVWGPLMCVAVIATGNHFVFDIVTGLVCTGLGFAVSLVLQRLYAGRRQTCSVKYHERFDHPVAA